jgi:hypothetical protein
MILQFCGKSEVKKQKPSKEQHGWSKRLPPSRGLPFGVFGSLRSRCLLVWVVGEVPTIETSPITRGKIIADLSPLPPLPPVPQEVLEEIKSKRIVPVDTPQAIVASVEFRVHFSLLHLDGLFVSSSLYRHYHQRQNRQENPHCRGLKHPNEST